MPVVSIPNVGEVSFPDSMSHEDIARAIERDILKTPQPGFFSSVGRGLKESLASTPETMGYGAEAFGLESIGKKLQDIKHTPSNIPEMHLRNIENFGDAKQFLGESLGSGVGSTVPSIISGGLGAIAGGVPGAVVGAAATSVPLNTGDLFKQLLEEGVDRSRAAELARHWGPILSVPDVASLGILAKPFMKGGAKLTVVELAKKLAAEEGVKGTAKVVGKGAAKIGAVESGTELGQQAGQEYIVANETGTPFMTPDRMERIAESGIAGGLMGGAFGGVGGLHRRGRERDQLQQGIAQSDAWAQGEDRTVQGLLDNRTMGDDAVGLYQIAQQRKAEQQELGDVARQRMLQRVGVIPTQQQNIQELAPTSMPNLASLATRVEPPVPQQPAPTAEAGEVARQRILDKIGVTPPPAPTDVLTPNGRVDLTAGAKRVDSEVVDNPDAPLKSKEVTDAFKAAHEEVRPTQRIKRAQYRALRPLFEDAVSFNEVISNIDAAIAKSKDQTRTEILGQFRANLLKQRGIDDGVRPVATPAAVNAGTNGAVSTDGRGNVTSTGESVQTDAAPGTTVPTTTDTLERTDEDTGGVDGGTQGSTPALTRPHTVIQDKSILAAERKAQEDAVDTVPISREDGAAIVRAAHPTTGTADGNAFRQYLDFFGGNVSRALEGIAYDALPVRALEKVGDAGSAHVLTPGHAERATRFISTLSPKMQVELTNRVQQAKERRDRGTKWWAGKSLKEGEVKHYTRMDEEEEARTNLKVMERAMPRRLVNALRELSSAGGVAYHHKGLPEAKKKEQDRVKSLFKEHTTLSDDDIAAFFTQDRTRKQVADVLLQRWIDDHPQVRKKIVGTNGEITNKQIQAMRELVGEPEEEIAPEPVAPTKEEQKAKERQEMQDKQTPEQKVKREARRAEEDAVIDKINKEGRERMGDKWIDFADELSGLDKHVPAGVTQAVRANQAINALRIIAEYGNTFERFIARRLIPFIGGTRVGFVPNITNNEGVQAPGRYNGDTNTAEFHEGQWLTTHTFLHEMVHAATQNIIAGKMEGLNAIQRSALRGLENLFKEVSNNSALTGKYGLKNLREFVAEALSNGSFQEDLKNIETKSNGIQKAWSWFVNAVRDLIGVNNAFANAVEYTDALFSAAKKQSEVGIENAPTVNDPALQQQLDAAQTRHPPAAKPSTIEEITKAITKAIKSPGAVFDRALNAAAWHGDQLVKNLNAKADGAMVDIFGKARPDWLLSQVASHYKVADAVMRMGGLKRNADGQWEAVKTDTPLSKVFDQIKKLAEDPRVGDPKVARVMANLGIKALRQDELQKKYNLDLANVQRLRAAGNNTAAKQVEDRMVKPDRAYTPQVIAQDLQLVTDYPEIKEIDRIWTEFNNGLTDALQASGRISSTTANNWKANLGYAPLYRVQDDAEYDYTTKARFPSGGLTDTANTKKLEGDSELASEDVFANMQEVARWKVSSSMKNATANDIAQYPGISTTDVNGVVKEYTQAKFANHPVRMFRAGKPVYIDIVEPENLAAFYGADPKILTGLEKALQTGSRILRAGTTMNPSFVVMQVFSKDPIRAAMLSGVKDPVAVALKVPKIWGQLVIGKKFPDLQRLYSHGIVGGVDSSSGHNIDQAIEKEIGLVKKTWGDWFTQLGESLAVKSDMAQRLAIYQQTMEETGNESIALIRARDIINFDKQGTNAAVNWFRQVVPFMGGYLSGMDVLARAARGRGLDNLTRERMRNRFWAMNAKVAMMMVAYTMLMEDDEEYKKMPDDERLRSLLVPGTSVKLPMPTDLSFIFKSIPELTTMYVMQHGTDKPADFTRVAKAFGNGLVDAYSSPMGMALMPQVIKPAVEIALNHSFFTGRPIVGEHQKGLDTAEQYTSGPRGTSELGKMIGSTGVISPMNADHLLRGALGMSGALAMDLTNELFNTGRPASKAEEMSPFRSFLVQDTDAARKNLFYDLFSRAEKVNNTVNEMKKNRPQALKEYLADEDHKELYKVYKILAAQKKFIDNTRAEITRISEASDRLLPQEKKRPMIDRLNQREAKFLESVPLEKYRERAGL